MPDPAESALDNVRAEWVASADAGDGTYTMPSNPSWNRFSDYIESYPGWSGDAGTEGQTAVGHGDIEDHFRGPEEHDLTVEWWMQRHVVDGSGNANDPIGAIINYTYDGEYPAHEVLFRREVTSGGVDGAGYREFVYASGARPSSGSLPGDPSASEPIVAEAGYACERVRQHVIHQPSDGTVLDLVSTDANDTMDVTIENEDAGTTETISLNGTTTVTTTTSFTDIDAIWLASEPAGDVSVKDDAGNDLLEDDFAGSNTDGVDGDRGVPSLGTGSHASAIGTDPANYVFLGTSSDWTVGSGDQLADRVHALDLSIDVDMSREPRQSTRRQAIDPGTRTVSADVDLAGPTESAEQNANYFRGRTSDLTYTLPDGTITVKNAQLADTDDVERSAGDANMVYGISMEGHGDPAVTAAHS